MTKTEKTTKIKEWFSEQAYNIPNEPSIRDNCVPPLWEYIKSHERGAYKATYYDSNYKDVCICFKCKTTSIFEDQSDEGTPLVCPSCGEVATKTTREGISSFGKKTRISTIVKFDETLGAAILVSFDRYPSFLVNEDDGNGLDRISLFISDIPHYSLLSCDGRVWGNKDLVGEWVKRSQNSAWTLSSNTSDGTLELVKKLKGAPLLGATPSLHNYEDVIIPSPEGDAFLKAAGADSYALFFEKSYQAYTDKKNKNMKKRDEMLASIWGGPSLPSYSSEDIYSLIRENNAHVGYYDNREEMYYCSCGKVYTHKNLYNAPCPDVPEDVKCFHNSIVFVKYSPKDDAFIWRYCQSKLDNGKLSFVEKMRVIFSAAGTYSFEREQKYSQDEGYIFGEWQKISTYRLLQAAQWSFSGALYCPLGSATAGYEKSFLRYSGLMEEWNKGKRPWAIGLDSLIYQWTRRPWLNQLANVGLTNILTSLNSIPNNSIEECGINQKATSLPKILGVTRPLLKMMVELNPSFHQFRFIKDVWNADQTVEIEDIKTLLRWCDASFPLYDDIRTIMRDFHISGRDVVEYAISVRNTRFKKVSQAIRIWKKYLNNCELLVALGDMKKIDKYPEDIDLALSKSERFQERYKEEINAKKLADNCAAAEYLAFEGTESDRYFISLPKTREDFDDEAAQLDHCVWRYPQSVAEGDTIIVFLREKAAPKKSLYTIEVRRGEIKQVEGDKDHRTCTEGSVAVFIKKWAARNKLRIAAETRII